MKKMLIPFLLLSSLAASGNLNAAVITIEPDNYASGTVMTSISPFVLIRAVEVTQEGSNNPTVAFTPVLTTNSGPAVTGQSRFIGQNGGFAVIANFNFGFRRTFAADFDTPVSTVTIDAILPPGVGAGLEAWANNQLIAEDGENVSHTDTITRSLTVATGSDLIDFIRIPLYLSPQIAGNQGEAYFDNLRFSGTAIPEASSILLCFALLPLGFPVLLFRKSSN